MSAAARPKRVVLRCRMFPQDPEQARLLDMYRSLQDQPDKPQSLEGDFLRRCLLVGFQHLYPSAAFNRPGTMIDLTERHRQTIVAEVAAEVNNTSQNGAAHANENTQARASGPRLDIDQLLGRGAAPASQT